MNRRIRVARALCAVACALGSLTGAGLPLLLPTTLYAQPQAQELSKEKEDEYAKDSSTEINVKNADIAAIVRIFSRKTKRNYILDENVKGKVTIYLPGKVSSEEAIRILDTVLNLKGFSSVPVGENLWKIVAAKDAKQSTIPTIVDDDEASQMPSAAVVTRLINLKYIKAEDLQQLLSQLISANGLINAYTGTNSLLIIDAEDNIERLVRIVQSLDVPFSNREMSIIPIKFADAVGVSEKLVEIMGGGSKGDGKSDPAASLSSLTVDPRQGGSIQQTAGLGNGKGAGPAVLTTGSGTVTGRGLEPKIIPDERTNSIIVVADEDMTARIKALVSQLDSEVDLSGSQFFVYRCQHANAEDLADVLSGLVSGGGSGSSSGSGSGSGSNSSLRGNFGANGFGGSDSRDFGSSTAGGFNRSTGFRSGAGSDSSSLRNRSSFGGGSSTFGAGSSRGNSGSSGTANLGEELSVTADPATNSLVIYGNKSDYERIKSLLEKLDIKRRQVLVEAMLLEVAIEDELRAGTEFIASVGGADGGVIAKSDFGNLAQLLSDPTRLPGFSVAAASSGTLTLPGDITIPTQTILMTAAQTNRNVNVLSAPNILATDNEEAEIVVGQNVPFLASVSTNETNLNNTFNQVEREDVGIKLRLTPQISSRDFVTLNMETEVSNVLSVSPQLGPTTTIRTSRTTVIAKNGQMIVIGGLMADDNQKSGTGVPFLQDVPVLGHLFRFGVEAVKRTNLLIFITPRILKDQFDAREATVVKRNKMEDVIASQEAQPDRQDLLRNDDINSVSESLLYEGDKPSTIIPPAAVVKERTRKADQPKARLESKSVQESIEVRKPAPDEVASVDEEEEVLQLEASPQVPREKLPVVATDETRDDESQAVPVALQQNSVEKSDQSSFVVFKIDSRAEIPGQLPFAVNTDTLTFGVELPGSSQNSAKQFFRVGQTYRYVVGGKELQISPIGTFSEDAEAARIHPEIAGNWHTLSPYEIMNLGRGPWLRSAPR